MYSDRIKYYEQIEGFTNSKVICYVTGNKPNMEIQIALDVLDHFVEHLDSIGQTESISLVIYSMGGNTLAGWSLVNLIKQFCKKFHVIIPSKAHSTATLISLGASSILMTKQATIGPIDPSVNGPLNPQMPGQNPLARIPINVEAINGYFEFAKSFGVHSEREIAQIIINLAEKIHPTVLGNVFRSRSQIRMLGSRLMAHHINDQTKREKILDFLCSESGSHDYTINRREARDELGLNITKPDDAQYKIIKQLHDDYSRELELMTPFDPNVLLGQVPSVDYSITRGIIESIAGGSTKFISKGKLTRTRVQVGPVAQEGIQDMRLSERWTHDKQP